MIISNERFYNHYKERGIQTRDLLLTFSTVGFYAKSFIDANGNTRDRNKMIIEGVADRLKCSKYA